MTSQTPGGSSLPPAALAGLDLCTKCSREPVTAGQRWGKACRAAYMRSWRRRRKQVQLDLLELVDQIRDQASGGWPS